MMRILALSAMALLTSMTAWAADAPVIHALGAIAAPDGPWDYAIVDAANDRLLVGRGDGVLALALSSQAVMPKFVPGARVHGVITLPSGLGVSTNGASNAVTIFDAATGTVQMDIAVGQNPDALIHEPKTNLVMVMNGKSEDISLVDVLGGRVVGTIPVGGKLEFAAIDGTGLVFVAVEDKSEIAVIDATKRKVVRRIKLKGCEEPTGLARDGLYGVVIAACGGGQAIAVDGKSGNIIAALKIGKGPDAVILDAARHLAFIPSGGSGDLAVIRIAGRGKVEQLKTVPTQKGARTGALDAKTGRLYLPTADYTLPKDGERRAMVPGTFRILVLSTKG